MASRLPHIGGQVQSELDELIVLANKLRPKSYLEIGAREGIALRYFVERVPTIREVVVVDMPGGPWGREASEALLMKNLKELTKAEHRVRVFTILADSQLPEIVRAIATESYDMIFIDADHTYEGALKDYDNYAHLANKLCCLHDINHPPDSKAYGATRVWQLVKEGADEDKVTEIIAAGSRKGIGVIYTHG